MYDIIPYETNSGRCPVTDYIAKLARDKSNTSLITRIRLFVERLELHGLEVNQHYPNTIKPIRAKEKLYELRPGSSRVFFFAFDEDSFVLLHAFTKTSNKTPKREIDNALQELKDYKRRNGHG